MSEVTDKESNAMLVKLKSLSNNWKERLANPIVKEMVESGQITISPLVKKLISMFPDSPIKKKGGIKQGGEL